MEAPRDAIVGDRFPVAVNVDVPDGASNFSFTVHYDAVLLKFVSARQGNFMAQGNAIARLSTEPNIAEGFLGFKLEQDGGPPVGGAGGLVIIEFEAVADARAPARIALAEVSISAGDDRAVPYQAPKDILLAVRR
jgi:hypothetical protein